MGVRTVNPSTCDIDSEWISKFPADESNRKTLAQRLAPFSVKCRLSSKGVSGKPIPFTAFKSLLGA